MHACGTAHSSIGTGCGRDILETSAVVMSHEGLRMALFVLEFHAKYCIINVQRERRNGGGGVHHDRFVVSEPPQQPILTENSGQLN